MKKILSAILLGIFLSGPLLAAEQWEYKRVSHVAMGESLTSFFADLGSGADVLVNMSSELRNRRDLVTATYSDKKIIDILNDISNAYSLIWYWDGQTIYIYDLSELQERKIELFDNSAAALTQALKDYGFYDGRYPLKTNASGNVAYFSAPPRYAQLIIQIADEVNTAASKNKDNINSFRFRAFPLKYATAYDREIEYDDTIQIIPGVATLLNQAIGQGTTDLNRSSTGRIGQKLEGSNFDVTSQDAEDIIGDVVRLKSQKSSRSTKNPSITADKQTNSIIIYDTLENINKYGEFINDFDQPVSQIEISVSIIDVQSDELNEIGVSWAGNGTDFDVGFGGTAAIEATNSASSFVGFGNYQNTTTLLASQVKTIMGNIKAITETNGAKVLSKPAVVTQDNLEAIIDHVSTFYVRLEGQEEVELVPIQSGSVLRVIPRLLGGNQDPRKSEIQLKVSIEDGTTNSDNRVDNIPIVTSSTIKTQAVVVNGESLLVGGFYYDSEQDDVVKVPILGDIPVIKALFRHTKKRKVQLSRLFLITPRIVGNRLDSMEKLRVLDSLNDVKRMEKKDYFFNSMIMD